MTFSVTIEQAAVPITVEIGQTILEAAIGVGIPYPHGCRSGNCGACKSRLISGEVEMSPYSEFALTADERDNGLVLACRSVPWEDAEIERAFDHRLDRREAGAAGQRDDRPAMRLAQPRRAERSLDRDFLSDGEVFGDMGARRAAGDVTDVELNTFLVRRIGHRIVAWRQIGEGD